MHYCMGNTKEAGILSVARPKEKSLDLETDYILAFNLPVGDINST